MGYVSLQVLSGRDLRERLSLADSLYLCSGSMSIHKYLGLCSFASIEHIGKKWPDARGEALAILQERLEWFEENESDVNAFLVGALVELGAKEVAPLIERAFAEGYVDPMVMGDREDVQVELGLKSAKEVAHKQVSKLREGPWRSPPAEQTFTSASSQVTHKKKDTQKKAKSKMAKLSRKNSRKQ